MTTNEIIEKLPEWNTVTTMSANEHLASVMVGEKVQEIVGIHPVNEVEEQILAKFAKLIWLSAKNYTTSTVDSE